MELTFFTNYVSFCHNIDSFMKYVKCNEMTSNLYITLFGHSKMFDMTTVISIHKYIHMLMVVSYWIIAMTALGQVDMLQSYQTL